ncbi:TRAP transporter large permease [Anaeromicrobium sediminis]|uniref:C4-dicarboxylate ABC transporter permease n=1 Tax=Anaeromicrobium sediminis TaxID=1478221 RepID=A0A267MJ91_9FIRM|nr:TRAP transporter large permease [Anaeromicrobium sediminis]PAB59639.1 C4-dicarboxylate ABC transporter permease [Anaeromicrobium sediminis]
MLNIVLMDVILLVVLLMMSVPLPYCFGGALLFMSIFGGVSMKSMMLWGFSSTISPVLLASPLFVLAGTLMGGSGIAKHLLNLADVFVGRIRGGLGVVTVATCAFIGAISGSGFTGVAATGPILIPRMVKQGYPRGYATSIVTVSSILGLLIPPSVIMILYGWVTETSILACFLSTVGPGLAIVITFSVINLMWAKKMPDLVLDPPLEAKEKIKVLTNRTWIAIPALCLPVVILGGIYGGIFTPTEAAGVATIISIPIGFFIYKELSPKKFYELIKESTVSVGAIMTMIIFTLMLSQTYVMLQVPQAIIEMFFNITSNKILMLLIINVFLFLVGMIVNDSTGMILVAPLLLPLVTKLGLSPVHFAAIMGVNLAMGGVTPPYASILYLGMRIGKCEFDEIIKPTMVFLLCGYLPIVILTTFFPELSLFLPRLMGLV